MNRNVWALALYGLTAGCIPGSDDHPRVGQAGILVSYEKDSDAVVISSDRFKLGFEVTPDGTKADYLGEAPELKDSPGTHQIKIAIRSGEHEGRAVTVAASHWKPIDR